jgi:hypothetical protein
MATHVAGEADGHSPTELLDDNAAPEQPRSGYGLVPGAELPGAMYLTALLAYVWMLTAAWLAFGSSEESDLNLGVVSVLTIVMFALPILIVRTATRRLSKRSPNSSNLVGTATGDLPMSEACVQILLLPLALALAATAFGLTYYFVG